MSKLICAAVCAVALSVVPGMAKDPPPFKDFKPKFVKAPKAGAKRTPLPQIEAPRAPAPAPVVATPDTPRQAPQSAFAWFWKDVSPDLADAGPGRLDEALRAIARSDTAVPVPRLQTLQTLARNRGVEILKATIGTDVSPALALAVMWAESAGKADATSRAGALGLMQLMPATAERFGVEDAFAPAQNIAGGVRYLDWLMKEFDRDPVLVLAAYNSGEGSVRKHKGVPPFAETRDYVPKVLATFRIARGLCLTPPELITDGCVFAGMGS